MAYFIIVSHHTFFVFFTADGGKIENGLLSHLINRYTPASGNGTNHPFLQFQGEKHHKNQTNSILTKHWGADHIL